MPLFSEIGPITLDPEIEKKALANLENDSVTFKVELSEISPAKEDMIFPAFGAIIFNKVDRKMTVNYIKSELESYIVLASCEYSESYPTIELNQKDNKKFDIHVSQDQSFKCSIDDPSQRDILALTIRFCEKIKFDQPPETTEEVIPLFLG